MLLYRAGLTLDSINKYGATMFIDNKYTRCYNRIIENRKLNLPIGYVEKHHIIPKSLGGPNRKENIVSLTAREHFICHMLLVKMTQGKEKVKMAYALRSMMRLENPYQGRHKISAKLYESLIKLTKPIIGQYLRGDQNPFYGKVHSKESKMKMKNKRALQEAPMLGKTHSDITKDLLREANKKQFSNPKQIEIRKVRSKQLWSDPEWRSKYKGNTGKSFYNNGSQSKMFVPGEEPEGWVRGRIFFKRRGNND